MFHARSWLDELASQRPRGCAALTQELINQVGAIPKSPPPGTPAVELIEYYSEIKFLPLNADDRFVVAMNRAMELNAAGNEVEYAEARAETAFWAHVRDWTNQWVIADNFARWLRD
jgi:hypothetical protein